MSSKLVGSDIPGLQAPVPLRFLWLFSGIILLALANANLAYMMTKTDSPVIPVVENFTSHEAVSEDNDGLVALCALNDVVCPGEETPVATIPQRLEGRAISTVIKKNATPSMQEMVDYAWSISKSVDFILTVEAESGFNPKARNVNRNGTVDSGIAQINHFYHPKIVKDPRFADWKWQLEKGWELYKSGVKFYGFDVRHRVRDRFVME